jgi:serine/threonine protein kinase
MDYITCMDKDLNILLTADLIPKLADFGFTCTIAGKDRSGTMHTKLRTEDYMALEIQLKNYIGT